MNNTSHHCERFRKNKYIEAIILLPENIMFGIKSPLALIVFSKGNKKIRFLNASNFGKKKKIKGKEINILKDSDVDEVINLLNSNSNSEVAISKNIKDFSKNCYVLDVGENISPSNIVFSKETVRFVKFNTLIKNIMRGSQASAKEIGISPKKTSNIYLSMSDINDGLIDFENIETYLENIPENQEKFLVKDECILLSKYGNSFKLAIAEIPEDKKVIASGNFIVIEVDKTKINPYYLAALFSSNKRSKILKEFYSASSNGNLSIKKLKELMLPIPTKELEDEIVRKYSKIIRKIEKHKKELKDLIDSEEKSLEKLKVEVYYE